GPRLLRTPLPRAPPGCLPLGTRDPGPRARTGTKPLRTGDDGSGARALLPGDAWCRTRVGHQTPTPARGLGLLRGVLRRHGRKPSRTQFIGRRRDGGTEQTGKTLPLGTHGAVVAPRDPGRTLCPSGHRGDPARRVARPPGVAVERA